VRLEIQAHKANDEATLLRHLAAAPDSVELDVGLSGGRLVVGHETDLSDASALTLDRALEVAGGTPLVADVKCYPPQTASPAEFAAALEPYLGRLRLVSFSAEVVALVRGRAPVTFLFEEPWQVEPVADAIGPDHRLVTAELVDAAHAAGMRVVPWTVNDPERMRELVALGVDGLVTDEPALARRVVR
jgi:glycerophosphoryl diester phosphodiesterase